MKISCEGSFITWQHFATVNWSRDALTQVYLCERCLFCYLCKSHRPPNMCTLSKAHTRIPREWNLKFTASRQVNQGRFYCSLSLHSTEISCALLAISCEIAFSTEIRFHGRKMQKSCFNFLQTDVTQLHAETEWYYPCARLFELNSTFNPFSVKRNNFPWIIFLPLEWNYKPQTEKDKKNNYYMRIEKVCSFWCCLFMCG